MATIATPNISPATSACPVLPQGALAVTPSDANTYACPVSIYVGVAGNVVCTPANGNADVTIAMAACAMVPFRVTAVKATGTTATSMVAVY